MGEWQALAFGIHATNMTFFQEHHPAQLRAQDTSLK